MKVPFPKSCVYALISSALLLASGFALAGPPFMTDDPGVVDYQTSEFYIFSTYDKVGGSKEVGGPAFEYNYGFHPDWMVHVIVPFTHVSNQGEPSHSGLGDIELGLKWVVLDESASTPAIALFPIATIPTGDSSKDLGGSKPTLMFPVWIGKSWGDWTTYGGVGYSIDKNPENPKNSWLGGWLLQKDIGEKWTLGGELYGQTATEEGGSSTSFATFGGYYKFTPNFNLLFDLGHSTSGDSETTGYLGLWWAFGGDQKAEQASATQPAAWSLSHRSLSQR